MNNCQTVTDYDHSDDVAGAQHTTPSISVAANTVTDLEEKPRIPLPDTSPELSSGWNQLMLNTFARIGTTAHEGSITHELPLTCDSDKVEFPDVEVPPSDPAAASPLLSPIALAPNEAAKSRSSEGQVRTCDCVELCECRVLTKTFSNTVLETKQSHLDFEALSGKQDSVEATYRCGNVFLAHDSDGNEATLHQNQTLPSNTSQSHEMLMVPTETTAEFCSSTILTTPSEDSAAASSSSCASIEACPEYEDSLETTSSLASTKPNAAKQFDIRTNMHQRRTHQSSTHQSRTLSSSTPLSSTPLSVATSRTSGFSGTNTVASLTNASENASAVENISLSDKSCAEPTILGNEDRVAGEEKLRCGDNVCTNVCVHSIAKCISKNWTQRNDVTKGEVFTEDRAKIWREDCVPECVNKEKAECAKKAELDEIWPEETLSSGDQYVKELDGLWAKASPNPVTEAERRKDESHFWRTLHPDTDVIAYDCECVPIPVTDSTDHRKHRPECALLCVVDFRERPLLEVRVRHLRGSFVVNDHTLKVNGIRHKDLENGLPMANVVMEFAHLSRLPATRAKKLKINSRLLVAWGEQEHTYMSAPSDARHFDLQTFFAQCSFCDVNPGDPVSTCLCPKQRLGLAAVYFHLFGIVIQRRLHTPREDAAATMRIFREVFLPEMKRYGEFALRTVVQRNGPWSRRRR